jgi:hypothetical protein
MRELIENPAELMRELRIAPNTRTAMKRSKNIHRININQSVSQSVIVTEWNRTEFDVCFLLSSQEREGVDRSRKSSSTSQ